MVISLVDIIILSLSYRCDILWYWILHVKKTQTAKISDEMTVETMVNGDADDWDGIGVGGTQVAFLAGSGEKSGVGDAECDVGIGDGGW